MQVYRHQKIISLVVRHWSRPKIYYTIGDQGRNQLAYLFLPNQAQHTLTQQELNSKDYHTYMGKVLRLNLTEVFLKTTQALTERSHIYTLGHRNLPRFLAFAPNAFTIGVKGPNSDDEINLVLKGGNYGWPNVAWL